jgi:hypothetical protein
MAPRPYCWMANIHWPCISCNPIFALGTKSELIPCSILNLFALDVEGRDLQRVIGAILMQDEFLTGSKAQIGYFVGQGIAYAAALVAYAPDEELQALRRAELFGVPAQRGFPVAPALFREHALGE